MKTSAKSGAMSSKAVADVNNDEVIEDQDLDDEMAEDGGDEEDDFWLGKLGDFLSPCRPVFRSESTESPAPITNTKEEPAVSAAAKNPKTEPIVPAVDVVDGPIVSVAADPVAVVTPEPTKPTRKRRAKTNVTVTINPRAGATKRKAAGAAGEAIAAVKRNDKEDEELEGAASGDTSDDPAAGTGSEEKNSVEEKDPVEEDNYEVLPLNLEGLVSTEVLHSSFIKTPEDLKDRIKLLLEKNKEKKTKKKKGPLANFDHTRKCPLCGELCTSTPFLNRHIKEMHGVEGVVCPHCSKILAKNCTLSRHIEQVHFNLQIHKPAKCDQCDKVFSKKGHLDRHIKTIHMGMKEESQPCPHCGKVFSTKSSLEPHIMMVHQGMRKKCPECGKVLSDLWKHMRTMHGQYRRRTKISKEEALENNLVPKDTKSRVNVKDVAAAKAVPTFTAEVDNPNAIEMVQVDLFNKKSAEHKYLDKVSPEEYQKSLKNDGEDNTPDTFNPDTHGGNSDSNNVENKVQNKRRRGGGKKTKAK